MRPGRRTRIVLLAAALALTTRPGSTPAEAAGAAQRPAPPGPAARANVVIILADDLGHGDLGCYGHPRF